jgi:hypothetical protein
MASQKRVTEQSEVCHRIVSLSNALGSSTRLASISEPDAVFLSIKGRQVRRLTVLPRGIPSGEEFDVYPGGRPSSH